MQPLFAGEADTLRDVVYSGLSSWRLVYDGRYKLVEGYDPEFRTGPHFEPMQVGPKIAAQRQDERETILWDVKQGETENLASDLPEEVARLRKRLIEIRDRSSPA